MEVFTTITPQLWLLEWCSSQWACARFCFPKVCNGITASQFIIIFSPKLVYPFTLSPMASVYFLCFLSSLAFDMLTLIFVHLVIMKRYLTVVLMYIFLISNEVEHLFENFLKIFFGHSWFLFCEIFCIQHKELRTLGTLQNGFHESHDSIVNWHVMGTPKTTKTSTTTALNKPPTAGTN